MLASHKIERHHVNVITRNIKEFIADQIYYEISDNHVINCPMPAMHFDYSITNQLVGVIMINSMQQKKANAAKISRPFTVRTKYAWNACMGIPLCLAIALEYKVT